MLDLIKEVWNITHRLLPVQSNNQDGDWNLNRQWLARTQIKLSCCCPWMIGNCWSTIVATQLVFVGMNGNIIADLSAINTSTMLTTIETITTIEVTIEGGADYGRRWKPGSLLGNMVIIDCTWTSHQNSANSCILWSRFHKSNGSGCLLLISPVFNLPKEFLITCILFVALYPVMVIESSDLHWWLMIPSS